MSKNIGLMAFILLAALTFQGCEKPADSPSETEGSVVNEVMNEEEKDENESEEEGESEDEEGDQEEMDNEASLGLEDGNWVLDPSASTLNWSASRLAATPHTGQVPITKGNVQLADGKFVSGGFSIDMTGITEDKNSERFLTHVKSDDFFGVDAYPTSTFAITKVEKAGEGQFNVTGDLTIRDKTNSISFVANLSGDGNTLSATAQFEIDRTRWGIIFDSSSFFQNLGDKAIKNEILYDLNLSFVAG